MARSLLVLTALLALSSCLSLTQAAATYDQDVQTIEIAKSYAEQLQQDADKLTETDAALLQVNMGGFVTVLKDLALIDNALRNATSELEGIVFRVCGGQPLATAFYTFTSDIDDALKSLEDKAGLFATLPALGSKVADGVKEVKNAYDVFVRQLADSCPDSGVAFLDTAGELNNDFDTVINTYDGGAVTKEVAGGGGLGLP